MCTIRVCFRLSVTPSFRDLCCLRQGRLRLGPSATGHYPVVRPPRELVSFVPHLLIEGSQQDIAQQRRYDSALRSSSWSFVTATLIFIAGLQHLLNKPQHPAVSDLLSDKSQQSIVIHGSKIIFQIRIHDPLGVRPPLHARSLVRASAVLRPFSIPKAAWIKDLFKDGLQAVGQCLLTHSVIGQKVCLKAWSCPEHPSSDLQSSHRLRLIVCFPEFSVKSAQIFHPDFASKFPIVTLSAPLAPRLARTRSHASFKFSRE